MKSNKIKRIRVTRRQLLVSFEHLCEVYEVESAGFNRHKITAPVDGAKYDGKTRWAMRYVTGKGWMIVCGWKGVGGKFTRYNGYIHNRWDFLMLIEGLAWTLGTIKRQHKIKLNE